MFTLKSDIGAGKVWNLNAYGKYFLLVDCPQSVDVLLKKNGSTVYEAKAVDTGFYVDETVFDSIDIVAVTACTVKVGVSAGKGGYNRSGGTVTLNGQVKIACDSVITNNAPQIIGVAASKILDVSASRRGFRLYNNSANTIYIGSAGVTVANAVIRLGVGGYIDETQATMAEWWAVASAAGSELRIMEIF